MTVVCCFLSKQLASPLPPCGAPMDCRDQPRLAFGHLDQDLEEDGLMFDVVLSVIPGDQLCGQKLTEREPAQHPKTQTSLACSTPEGQMANAGGAPSMRVPLRDT
jgi:hypothetical protein